ncbi:MAG: hypothetical protein AB7P49_16125 [Bdellovibrionales bacterium]
MKRFTGKPYGRRLESKLELIQDQVFRGRRFVPKAKGCETGGETYPDARKTSTGR